MVPASAHQNWWQRWVYKWIVWLDTVSTAEHDVDGKHTDINPNGRTGIRLKHQALKCGNAAFVIALLDQQCRIGRPQFKVLGLLQHLAEGLVTLPLKGL